MLKHVISCEIGGNVAEVDLFSANGIASKQACCGESVSEFLVRCYAALYPGFRPRIIGGTPSEHSSKHNSPM